MSPRQVVAHGKHVYAAVGAKGGARILDAATGEALGECPGTDQASELILANGVLVARRPAHDVPTLRVHLRNRSDVHEIADGLVDV